MDIIYLRGLKIETIIGVFDWEREIKQTVVLDLEMAADIRQAAATDELKDTLNYKAVAKRLIDFVSHSEFKLVETLSERIVEIVLTEFSVPWVRLQLNKPGAVRGAEDVGIIIERGRGSNIEPRQHIRAGLAEMEQHYGTLTLSSIYESEAIGFEGDNFYNLVAGFDTPLDVYSVANILRLIEKNNGRIRTAKRFSARTLDLDILLYDDLILKNEQVDIPREEILKYAFVLLPLAEIAPDAQHPVTKQTYAALWQGLDKKGQSLWRVEIFRLGEHVGWANT